MDALDLSGQTAVVTGGTSGIGRGIATVLDEQGANVVPVSRTESRVKDAAEAVDCDLVLPTDVSERAEVEAMLETVANEHGSIEILVNCAGIFQEEKDPTDITDADWESVLGINLYGTFLACQTVPKYMTGGNRAIVNVGSMVSETPLKGITAYIASKGGIISLTRSLAVEYADRDIRVNTLQPGYVKTRQNREALESEKLRDAILRHTPMGRYGEAIEMGRVAAFLASPAASYVTGEAVMVDGGFSVL